MVVYHGSNVIVEHPRLVCQNRTLDFGYGFYTTTNLSQAINFANKVADRRECGSPHISMYEVPEINDLQLNFQVLIFPEPDGAWLDFVCANRNGNYHGQSYDIILGPVANDTIYRTFIAYEDGILTREETIARLKIKKLYNQMTFSTEAALQQLNYIGELNEKGDFK